jgi:putative membrane protein insertion efficiency factor
MATRRRGSRRGLRRLCGHGRIHDIPGRRGHRAQHRTPCLGGAGFKEPRDGQFCTLDDSGHVLRGPGPGHLPLRPTPRKRYCMPTLCEQEATGERKVSTLRKCLRRPEGYLTVLTVMAAMVLADASRPPGTQLGASAYIGSVRIYQRWASPRLDGYVRCRFRPTCSNYSIQAVGKHGLWRGLTMTVHRIWRCRRSVPLGTNDPSP